MGHISCRGCDFFFDNAHRLFKRPTSKFYNPLTKDGEYDKLIWAAAIALSLSFYCLGAIVYFFVIKIAKPENKE
jgi:hypothetical protein